MKRADWGVALIAAVGLLIVGSIAAAGFYLKRWSHTPLQGGLEKRVDALEARVEKLEQK